jgi:hypothetical protein
MPEEYEGGCQCGAVRYRIVGPAKALAVCHCKECQRQSGSAFGMGLFLPRDQFVLLRGTLKSFTRSSDSGRPVVCSFCPECGNRIIHEPSRAPGLVNVRAGTLDDTSWLTPGLQAWTQSKQKWLALGVAPAFEQQPERPENPSTEKSSPT